MSLPAIMVGSHGSTTSELELIDTKTISLSNSSLCYAQSVLIPIRLSSMTIGDTDNLMKINVAWKASGVTKFLSSFYFAYDDVSEKIKVTAISWEYIGTATPDTQYFYIDPSVPYAMIQSHLVGDTSDNSVEIQSGLTIWKGFVATDASHVSDIYTGTLNELDITCTIYGTNDYYNGITLGTPLLSKKTTASSVVLLGDAATFYDYPMVLPEDWSYLDLTISDLYNHISYLGELDLLPNDPSNAEYMTTVYNDLITVKQDIDDINTEVFGDDDDDPEEESDCRLLCKIKRLFKIKFWQVAVDNISNFYGTDPDRGTSTITENIMNGLYRSFFRHAGPTVNNMLEIQNKPSNPPPEAGFFPSDNIADPDTTLASEPYDQWSFLLSDFPTSSGYTYYWEAEARWWARMILWEFLGPSRMMAVTKIPLQGIPIPFPFGFRLRPVDTSNKKVYLPPAAIAQKSGKLYKYSPNSTVGVFFNLLAEAGDMASTFGGLTVGDNPKAAYDYYVSQFGGYPDIYWCSWTFLLDVTVFTNTTYCSNTDGKYYLIHPGLGTDVLTFFFIALGLRYGLPHIAKMFSGQIKRMMTKKRHNAVIDGQDRIYETAQNIQSMIVNKLLNIESTLLKLVDSIKYKRL